MLKTPKTGIYVAYPLTPLACSRRAFDDLVAWMERGTVRAGADVLAGDVSKVGLRWTPALLPDDPAGRP